MSEFKELFMILMSCPIVYIFEFTSKFLVTKALFSWIFVTFIIVC